jgi:hypothetical protein
MSQAPNVPGAYWFVDNPSTSQDCSSVQLLFDSYRCCAIRLRYVPDSNVQSLTDANSGNILFHNSPI